MLERENEMSKTKKTVLQWKSPVDGQTGLQMANNNNTVLSGIQLRRKHTHPAGLSSVYSCFCNVFLFAVGPLVLVGMFSGQRRCFILQFNLYIYYTCHLYLHLNCILCNFFYTHILFFTIWLLCLVARRKQVAQWATLNAQPWIRQSTVGVVCQSCKQNNN